MSKRQQVREPVQAYLDAPDRSLLDQMSLKIDLPRAEIIRLAIRRLSEELLGEAAPGRSMSSLVGVLDSAEDVPSDLAERHDEHLYADDAAPKRARRK